MKAQFETKGGDWLTVDIAKTFKLSPHLQAYEVANQMCKADVKLKVYDSSWLLIDCFEFIRGKWGKAIQIADMNGKGGSGYRDPVYNKQVGGVSNSLHLTLNSIDAQLKNVTQAIYNKFKGWLEQFCKEHNCQAELGWYDWGLHIGVIKKLPYKFNGLVYEFDKRTKK